MRNALRFIRLLRGRPDGLSKARLAALLGVGEESVANIATRARAILIENDDPEFIPWLPTGWGTHNYRLTTQLNEAEYHASLRWVRYGLTLVMRGTNMIRSYTRIQAARGEWNDAVMLSEMLDSIEVPIKELRDYLR